MERTLIINESTIQGIADQYCIPRERLAQLRRCECGAGYASYEVLTVAGKGWMGCGHATCTACHLKSAHGVVGDDAIEAYMEDWLDKFFAGENIPHYVKQCLTSETWKQRYW